MICTELKNKKPQIQLGPCLECPGTSGTLTIESHQRIFHCVCISFLELEVNWVHNMDNFFSVIQNLRKKTTTGPGYDLELELSTLTLTQV